VAGRRRRGPAAENLKDAIGGSRWPDRDTWYASLLHFTGAVRHPRRLVDWVASRRRIDPVSTHITTVDLVAWSSERDSAQPLPVTLASRR
jgi:hypothetical protein